MGCEMAVSEVSTPLGPMTAAATDDGLCLFLFSDQADLDDGLARVSGELRAEARKGSSPWFVQLETQLGEYFSLSRRAFGIPLLYTGTAFQRTVWRALESIPYGRTISYREEAAAVGRPESARAVASANARNRIELLIPCHRVIAADGSLSGYSGGIERKRALIELEAIGLTSGSRRPS